jgi:hypothetical protein
MATGESAHWSGYGFIAWLFAGSVIDAAIDTDPPVFASLQSASKASL